MAMEDTGEMEMTCFEIISYVGTAKSRYIEAVKKAREGAYDEAQVLLEQGDDAFKCGHDIHLKMLQQTAEGVKFDFNLLLLHAEDQMASAETIHII